LGKSYQNRALDAMFCRFSGVFARIPSDVPFARTHPAAMRRSPGTAAADVRLFVKRPRTQGNAAAAL